MKKLFFSGAFALSTFAFANTADVKSEIKKKKLLLKLNNQHF